jgi:hypothetical protein
MSEEQTFKFRAPPRLPDFGPVTVEELLRRGVSEELEGRAIDVITRCGWPRTGDPLGIKPCIPIPVDELKHILEIAEALDGRRHVLRLEEVRDYLRHQLKEQEVISALYLNTAASAEDPPLKWPVSDGAG